MSQIQQGVTPPKNIAQLMAGMGGIPQDLGVIFSTRRRNSVKVQSQDSNGNIVPLPGGLPEPQASMNGVMTFENMAANADRTVFTFDVVGQAPSGGQVTINMQTHNANGTAGFIEPITIEIQLDPTTPGLASRLIVIDQGVDAPK